MSASHPSRMRRRALLAMPALVAAAIGLTARPARANPGAVECVADLLGAS
jgi:hypothetical protein